MSLPIHELREKIAESLQRHNRLILQAPTGSGKSTQVPQMLLDAGLLGAGEVVVLQPRRLATRMLAARVAQERAVKLGDEVGYQIRLDRVTGPKTRIRFVTEGVLLRQMLESPQLKGVAAIVFDEFHERHLYGDITLARALHLQETMRPDLRLVIMSATLDAGQLKSYLQPCEVLQSEGRTFPVQIDYLQKPARETPLWELAEEQFERLCSSSDGDVLIFMPGAYEIGRTVQLFRARHSDCVVLPLHGELPPAEQDAAVARYRKRKVVVATNVAETSLTIDGVTLVIDSGLAKVARFDPYRGINTLLVEKISRASADQRAGRAGRTAPGRCLRLWTALEQNDRPAQELPEVKRLDLAEVVLTLKASGVVDVAGFRWLEPPEPRSLERAETLLLDLDAIDLHGAITALGRRMLAFPMHPRHARMLLEAQRLGCVREVALIAALAQGRPLLRRAEGKQMEQQREALFGEKAESDFFNLLKAYRYAEQHQFSVPACAPHGIHVGAAREASQLLGQFLRIAADQGLETSTHQATEEALQRCVLAGFADQVAVRCDAGTLRCQLVHNRRGVLARESMVHHSPLLVASEVREIQIKGDCEVLLSQATAIKEQWLQEVFPGAVTDVFEPFYDATQRRVMGRRLTKFRDLVLRKELTDKVPSEAAAAILAEQVVEGRCPLAGWDNNVEQWIARANRLREWMPELELPPIGEEERRALIEQICHGASTYKEIKDRPVAALVRSWFSRSQQELVEKFAPERVALPNGKKWKIIYDAKAAPTVAARIQELYGVEGSLTIAAGRVPLVIQVLAPSHRPIQVTTNLSNFWSESYPKIRQELQRKYPRHEWR